MILGLMATGAGGLPFTPLREASEQLFRHSCHLLTPAGKTCICQGGCLISIGLVCCVYKRFLSSWNILAQLIDIADVLCTAHLLPATHGRLSHCLDVLCYGRTWPGCRPVVWAHVAEHQQGLLRCPASVWCSCSCWISGRGQRHSALQLPCLVHRIAQPSPLVLDHAGPGWHRLQTACVRGPCVSGK